MKILLALASSALVVLAAPAPAQNHYILDDGGANSAIGYGLPEDYCWMQWYEAVNGLDTITSVQAYIPSTTPPGTPVHFCVWDDPNDDGDPSDLVLLSLLSASVQASAPNVFVNYVLSTPALVQGKFFVGAYLTEDGGMSPAALDYSVNPHVAYFSFNSAGTFDPYVINNNFPPTHIETIGAGIHGVFMLRAEGSGNAPAVYCTAKLNSNGCLPQIGYLGSPSASASSGFQIHGTNVLNQKAGFMLYTRAGRANVPFYGGTLCLASPLWRTPPQNSGGSLFGDDCSGYYAFDFNSWIASGMDRFLLPGTMVDAQYYSRDPGYPAPNNIGLTDALEFTIGP